MRKRRSSKKSSRIVLAVIVIIFIAAGLMTFLDVPKALSVFSQENTGQEQNAQGNATPTQGQLGGTVGANDNNGGNNQDAEMDKQVSEDEKQGQQAQAAGNQENQQSEYRIDVDVSEQIVRIYQQDAEIKQFTASTGVSDSTPLGDFEIQNRGEWFFSEKYQQGAKYWVSFKDWGVYLFHSLPMDEQKNIITEEAAKLGTPASHGCVRLEVENAKWIYDNIPQGTKVHIH